MSDISGVDISGVDISGATPAAAIDFSKVINEIITDVSGASAADLLRYIPRFAAHVHELDLPKADKRALVIGALHELVNRCIPDEAREAAHSLVDTVAPAALAGVIDMVRGRVSFVPAVMAAAPVVAQQSGNCLMAMFACIKK
jgi:hypothetical protein